MKEELINVFLNIFEGENRESIVPYLIRQYKSLYEIEPYQELDKVIRINSKFIAKEIKPFEDNVKKVINENAAICINKDSSYYVSVLTHKSYNIHLPEAMEINNILVSEDGNFAFAVYDSKVITVDLTEDTIIYEEEIQNSKNVVVDGNTLYFIGESNEEEIIFKKDFSIEGKVKEEKIKFLENRKTKCFLVKFNSKFVFVKERQYDTDDIYCNNERLCSIRRHFYKNCKYNIIYDNITKMWVVVNSDNYGIIIRPNGDFKRFNLRKDVNFERIKLCKGYIYSFDKKELIITNVNDDQWNKKSMVYDKIITPDSKLYDINAKGFSVINENVFYEIRRG